MFTRIQHKRADAVRWTSVNPTLAAGEIGVELDTLKIKVGNGITAWNDLAYIVRIEAETSWEYYATNWTTAPSLAGSTAAGDVYAYTLSGTTRYRLVPTTYSAAQDAFYSTFSGGVLSGLIVTRG